MGTKFEINDGLESVKTIAGRVSEEIWKPLEIIAQTVGGNFGMRIKQGPPFLEEFNPFSGSKEKIPYVAYFDPIEKSVTFNPSFVIENPRKAQRIAAHEGAHRAITRGYREIGLSEEKIKALEGEEYLGFHSFCNMGLEDPRVNNWDTRKFPGLSPINRETYDEIFKEDNAELIAGELNLIISKTGKYPRFAQAGSEISRFWHQKRHSKTLSPEVKRCLNRIQKYATKYQETIPKTEGELDEKEVIDKAQGCFITYHEDIWPEVKKLVEMDLHTEEMRQMVNDLLQKQKNLNEKKLEQNKLSSSGQGREQPESQGENKSNEQLQKEIEQLERELAPFNQMPKDAKEKLQKEIERATKDAIEKLGTNLQEKEAWAKEAKGRSDKLEKEIEELEKSLPKGEKDERDQGTLEGKMGQKQKQRDIDDKQEELNQELPEEGIQRTSGQQEEGNDKKEKEFAESLEEKREEKLSSELVQRELGKEIVEIEKAIEELQNGKEFPFPEDKLSKKTIQELEKLISQLPRSLKNQLRKQAEEQLEKLEDAINKELEGKLNLDKQELHREKRDREKSRREAAQKSEEARIERERIEKELERMRREAMTPYELARSEVVGLIDSLYFNLRRIFRPEDHGGEDYGFQSGRRLDLTRAMQSEKDFEQKLKLWSRETVPERKDIRFWHLVDVSGSMAGEKIEETFKGFIVACEAIDRVEDSNSDTLTILQGISAFHSHIFPLKELEARLNNNVENALSTLPKRTGDGDANTNTYSATVHALNSLKENLGITGNYLLTFSDGEPNHDIRDSLKNILKKNKEEQRRLKITTGLIWLGESGDEGRLKQLVAEYGYDFGLVMSVVKPTEGEKANGKKDFAENLADLLEELAKYPEKY